MAKSISSLLEATDRPEQRSSTHVLTEIVNNKPRRGLVDTGVVALDLENFLNLPPCVIDAAWRVLEPLLELLKTEYRCFAVRAVVSRTQGRDSDRGSCSDG